MTEREESESKLDFFLLLYRIVMYKVTFLPNISITVSS